MNKINVVYCGNPAFSVPTLAELSKHSLVKVIGVITSPDRPVGRGQRLTSPPVATFAKENGLRLIQTENINNSEEVAKLLSENNVDTIVVLSFSHFLKQSILDSTRLGCFNLHTSKLPKYRGAAPIQYAIWKGDRTTGVTIQKMVKKMDAGDIVYEKEVAILDSDTGDSLFSRLEKECASAIKEFIPNLVSGDVIYKPQDDEQVSFAPTLKKKDGLISFLSQNATEVINQVRAMHSWPGTYTFLNGIRVKVLEACKDSMQVNKGDVSVQNNKLVVGTREGSVRLLKVQLQGKKSCSDTELLNGLKNKIKEFRIEPN